MEPWGVHGRPAVGVYALIARVLGGAASGLQVGVWTGQQGRQDLAEGETQLYSSASGAEVYLDKDGNNKINAASGKDVVVNGGTAQVARKGDPITRGTLQLVATGVPISSIAWTYTPGDGSAVQSGTLNSTTPALITIHEQVDGGAPHFKA